MVPIDQAILDYQAGRIQVAEDAALAIGPSSPDYPAALHLCSVIACDRGHTSEALVLVDKAISLWPRNGGFYNTRARALAGLNRFDEAESAYREAFSILPQAMQIANNLGCLLRDRGDIGGALEWLCRAQDLAPNSSEVACNLAEAFASQGLYARSTQQFQHALSLQPDSPDALAKFGKLLLTLGHLQPAKECYEAALYRRPNDAASHTNLGIIYQKSGLNKLATQCFQTALDQDPDFADAHYNYGCLLQLDNRLNDAMDCYGRAIAANPLHGAALWARCMGELPILYNAQEEIAFQRARYTKQLEALATSLNEQKIAEALRGTIGSSQPFFLPYQGACDRDLQTLYGSIVARLLAGQKADVANTPAPGEPIRIGIVSGYFCEHTIWRLMLKGWLSQIDRIHFSVYSYHTGIIEDTQTEIARKTSDKFTSGPAVDIRAAIIADKPHVLIYPELGMDPTSARLAGERLAPVQCVSWGQPQTSGLPTIDFFLTSDLMEPADSEGRYTEQLIRLPNLGIYYAADERSAQLCTRREIGLREDAVVFWCGQALYKYLPQHDDVFAQIAERVPGSQFLFIGFEQSDAVTNQFKERLRKAFMSRGLKVDDHCVILRTLSQERFLGTIRCADIMLDSIGWSGGKSTLDALAETPVIVTQLGDFMRSRHTAAILTLIGVTETIADSTSDYIDIAIRLALDPAERSVMRTRMAEGIHRTRADVTPIRELERFLKGAIYGQH